MLPWQPFICLDEQKSSITLLYLVDVPSLFAHIVFTSSALHECEFVYFYEF